MSQFAHVTVRRRDEASLEADRQVPMGDAPLGSWTPMPRADLERAVGERLTDEAFRLDVETTAAGVRLTVTTTRRVGTIEYVGGADRRMLGPAIYALTDALNQR